MCVDPKDPEKFLAAADKIVRRSYGTEERELEDLHSTGHKIYDDTVNGLVRLSGISDRKTGDSRTNISVIMGLGLGDCRHHAQAKQLLFDVWQKHHMNTALKNAYDALKHGDTEGHVRHLEEFNAIESVELRTIDATVTAPVQTDGLYKVRRGKDGTALADPEGGMNPVEDHTMTILLQKNSSGILENLRFADSFYQEHYAWGDGDIPVGDLTLDENDHIVIPAKTLKAVDPESGRLIYQPVQLHPTPYAGKRDETSDDEHGKLLLLGIPVEKDFDLVKKLSRTPEERIAKFDVLHNWQTGETQTPATAKAAPESTDSRKASPKTARDSF